MPFPNHHSLGSQSKRRQAAREALIARVGRSGGRTRHTGGHVQLAVALIESAITWVSPPVRRVLDEIISAKGVVEADLLASSAGFRDRHELKRRLKREGLPNLKVLSRYIRVLFWVADWEQTGIALSRDALRSGFDPAIRFRCVKATTGCTWSEVRTLGASWVVLRLLQKCRRPGEVGTRVPLRSAH